MLYNLLLNSKKFKMEYDSNLELQTYKKIQQFIQTLPLETPWRGVVCMNILNGFLDTAMKSESENPHEVMAALDHMFVQMVEVYKTGNVDTIFGDNQSEVLSEASSSGV